MSYLVTQEEDLFLGTVCWTFGLPVAILIWCASSTKVSFINMVRKYISVRIKIYDCRWVSFCLIVCSFFLLFVMLKSKRSLLVLLLYSILCSFSWVKRGRNLFITSIDSGSLMFLFVLFILDLTTSHLLVHHWH